MGKHYKHDICRHLAHDICRHKTISSYYFSNFFFFFLINLVPYLKIAVAEESRSETEERRTRLKTLARLKEDNASLEANIADLKVDHLH